MLQFAYALSGVVCTVAGTIRMPPIAWLLQLCPRHVTLLPAVENGVATAQAVQPLEPPLDVPVYPAAHTVHADALLPVVPVPAVL